MVRYRVQYRDGSYDIIKCPQCNEDDLDHTHHEDAPLDMICISCKLHFELDQTTKEIVQVTAEPDREPPSIISGEKVETQREYQETARRMRKETK